MTDERPISRAGRTQDHRVSDTIRDVMSPIPQGLTVDAMISDAAELMRREDIGDVIVLEEDRLYGILTDRDIVVRVVAEGRDPSQTRVGDVCSRELTRSLHISARKVKDNAAQLRRGRSIEQIPYDGNDAVGDIKRVGRRDGGCFAIGCVCCRPDSCRRGEVSQDDDNWGEDVDATPDTVGRSGPAGDL